MPMLIIAAKVCPRGAEATVFAMLTALSNFGAAVSSYFGATLLVIFDVKSGNYDNLNSLLLIKVLCRLSTLLLVPIFVPDGCPNDELDVDKGESGTEEWGISCESTSGNNSRHNLADLMAFSTHGLLEACYGDSSADARHTDSNHSAVQSPFFSSDTRVLELDHHKGVEMRYRTNGFNAGGQGTSSTRDKVVIDTRIDTSRYFQYMSPHENLTTQNI